MTFVMKKKILLLCLLPNATHILQPCDVRIFRPLKIEWKKMVQKHMQATQKPITRVNFASIFHKAYLNALKPQTIKNSFETCGLYPFNPDKVDYSKCMSTRLKQISSSEDIETNINKISINEVLIELEKNIPTEVIKMFENALKCNQKPPTEEILFSVWKKYKNQIDGQNEQNSIFFNNEINSLSLPELNVNTNADVMEIRLDANDLINTNEILTIYVPGSNEENAAELNDLNEINIVHTIDNDNLPMLNSFDNILNIDAVQTNTRNYSDVTEIKENIDSSKALSDINIKCQTTSSTQSSSDILKETENKTVSNLIMKKRNIESQYEELWKEHLHYPRIEKTAKKEKVKQENIFSITSKKWKEIEIAKKKSIERQQAEKEEKKEQRLAKQKLKEEERRKKKEQQLAKRKLKEEKIGKKEEKEKTIKKQKFL